jgi:pyrroline-5-carboxylate reductase
MNRFDLCVSILRTCNIEFSEFLAHTMFSNPGSRLPTYQLPARCVPGKNGSLPPHSCSPQPTLQLRSSLVHMSSPPDSLPPVPFPSYGFIGIGTMSSAIVRGLCTLAEAPSSIILSPRNATKAATLLQAHPSIVSVAASNQDVLDRSNVVFIGVLPKQCEEVLRALKFTPHHTVVSLVSTSPLSLLVDACAPVPPSSIIRAIPLPPVAIHRGATVITPPHPLLHSLFRSLGHVVAVDSEAQLKQLLPVTCLMGQFYEQQLCTQRWLQAQGVDPATAAGWTGAVFHSMSYDSSRAQADTLAALVHEQTPGGLNEGIVNGMRYAASLPVVWLLMLPSPLPPASPVPQASTLLSPASSTSLLHVSKAGTLPPLSPCGPLSLCRALQPAPKPLSNRPSSTPPQLCTRACCP